MLDQCWYSRLSSFTLRVSPVLAVRRCEFTPQLMAGHHWRFLHTVGFQLGTVLFIHLQLGRFCLEGLVVAF